MPFKHFIVSVHKFVGKIGPAKKAPISEYVPRNFIWFIGKILPAPLITYDTNILLEDASAISLPNGGLDTSISHQTA